MSNKEISLMTREQLGELHYLDGNAFTYRGEIKSKKRGFTKKIINDYEIHFESDFSRWEIIKLIDGNYAIRYFSKTMNDYINYSVLLPTMFFK